LSSFAIVGIVGGVLAALIIVYVVWYQWGSANPTKILRQVLTLGLEEAKGEKGFQGRSRGCRGEDLR
jgi:hypothetical protein